MAAPVALAGAGNVNSATGLTGNSVTCSAPTNLADGDNLIAHVAHRGPGTLNTPTGWTALTPNASAVYALRSYIIHVTTASGFAMPTWTLTGTGGRWCIVVARITAGGNALAEDSSGALSGTTGTTSLVLPATTAVASASLLVGAGFAGRANNVAPTFSAPSGMTDEASTSIATGTGASSALAAWTQTLASAGSTGTRTSTITNAASNSVGYLATLVETTPPAPTPVLVHAIVGAPTAAGFTVAFATTNVVTGVRLAVSTNSGITSPSYTSSVVPDSDGYGKATITGLTANTQYWWALELDSVLDTGKQGAARTLPAVGSQASYGFVGGSCLDTGNNAAVLDELRSYVGTDGRGPLLLAWLGDWDYTHSSAGGSPIAPNVQATLRGERAGQLQLARMAQLVRSVPLVYSWSDIDSFGSNCDGTYTAVPAGNSMVRQFYPTPSLPVTTGLYYSFVVGRVRHIVTDERSFSSAIGATDNSSKTKLGSTQLAWFLAQLTAAEPVKVWHGDGTWVGSAGLGGDAWNAYSNERTAIGAYIVANRVNVYRIHGDAHTLAADDGSHNTWGGFPWTCAAPIARPDANAWPTGSGWTTSQGTWPASSGTGRQWGRWNVVDSGSAITITFSGYDSVGAAERVAMTTVFVVGVGLVTSSTTVPAVARRKARAVGLVTSSTTVRSSTRVKRRTAGLVTSSTTVPAVGRLKTRAAGLLESVTALFAPGRVKSARAGLITSSTTVPAVTAVSTPPPAVRPGTLTTGTTSSALVSSDTPSATLEATAR